MNPLVNFSKLIENDDYLVELGRSIWLMDNHRWALKVWETELKSQFYSLIHVDYHWDACYDFSISSDKEDELIRATSEQMVELIKEDKWIGYDSFIV